MPSHPQQLEIDVYQFEPETTPSQTEWCIALKTDAEAEPQIEIDGIDLDRDDRYLREPEEDLIAPLPQHQSWKKLVGAILTADYLQELVAILPDRSPMLDLVAQQLCQHLLKVYRHKLEETIQTQGLAAIDTSLPHFKLSAGRKQPQTLTLSLKPDRIQAHLKSSLANFFAQAGFWQEIARTIGANLVLQAIASVETRLGTPAFQALQPDQMIEEVKSYLLTLDRRLLEARIDFFSQVYCQDITHKIINGFNLPTCTLPDLERLLGIKPKPPALLETSFTLDPIAVVPTAIPIASSIRAQLRPDLWQPNADRLAVFQYRSKSNPNNYIEHYITNPGDIALLPWEAADQIINKFGFDTVKLQLIFAARTMEEYEPWNSTFTLKATDIIQLLGWDKNHSTNLTEKRNAVASTAYALSCLLVKSVWIEGKGNRQVDASTPIGRMWDVLIDPHGQIDWVTGKIEKPDEVYITVSPGLWTKHFLNRAGSKAKEALHQFGYLAKNILSIDPYHNEIALRLAIQLTLDARVRARNHNPYDYRVLNLLEEVLPKLEIERALQDKHRARDLKNRWNKALKLLMNLGWQIEFDPLTYPDWLQPSSSAAKPEDWRKIKVIERLLQAKLTIKPPHPIPSLLAKLTEPKKPKQLEAAPARELSSEQIQQGREKLGWSRKQLGGFLNLSADYIGKLERGDRMITPELEAKLRRLLHL